MTGNLRTPCISDEYTVRSPISDDPEHSVCVEAYYDMETDTTASRSVCIESHDLTQPHGRTSHICVDFDDFVRITAAVLAERDAAMDLPD